MKVDKQKPVIFHFVTWFPSSVTDIDGIFTRRHIELLVSDPSYNHIVIQKSKGNTSVANHIKSLAGMYKKVQIGKLQIIQLPDASTLYKFFFWRYKAQLEKFLLRKLVQTHQPSLLHLHVVYGFGKEAVFIKKEYQIPFIISEHMAPFPFEWIQDKHGFIQEPMEEANTIIAVGTAQAAQIETFTGKKPIVIPNVVDADEFFVDGKTNQQKAGNPSIILVGIYDKRKGADYLLEVLPAFLQHYPGCILHLVGHADEERMRILNEQIKTASLQQSVRFHGILSPKQLCKLYSQCDFYVCSSEWESFGVSVLEALFAGLPVLSTDCGGVREFMTNENGVLIENDRRNDSLLQGLLTIMEQLSSFKRTGISEEVKRRFSKPVILEKYNTVYKNLIQE